MARCSGSPANTSAGLRSSRSNAWAAAVALGALAFALVAIAAPPPFSRGLLFRIDRPATPPSYIFGTLHSNDPRVVALPEPVRAAFRNTHRLALEILLADAQEREFFAAAQYGDERRLADAFDAETLAAIRAALGAHAPRDDEFERLKPWAVLLLLAQPRVESAAATLDRELLAEARRHKRPVIGLEDPDEQIAALDSIPLASQAALVRWALTHRMEVEADHERAIAAWLTRDLAELARQARAPGHRHPALAPHLAALSLHLVEGRSALMAHRLFMPLREGRVFVAVGALHLYGDKGMLALLRRQGYRVTRVYRRGPTASRGEWNR
jgi:uncharacterized protein